MKYVVLFSLIFGIAFGDEAISLDSPQWGKQRYAAIESIRKELADPKTPLERKAALAGFELQLLEQDTKALDEDISQMKRDIELIQEGQKLVDQSQKIATSPEANPATEKTWQPVTTLAGSTTKNSAPFTISSDRWRVTWTIKPSASATAMMKGAPDKKADDYAGLTAEAVSEDSPKARSQDITMLKMGAGSDSTELRGAGMWSLKVNSANADWTLVVEEYR